MTRHMEKLQLEFRCCGADSLEDWVGLGKGLNTSVSFIPGRVRGVIDESRYRFYPWQSSTYHVSPTCCDSVQTNDCTLEALIDRALSVAGMDYDEYAKKLPVYRRGCIDSMTSHIRLELWHAFSTPLTMLLLMHCVHCSTCVLLYYQVKPISQTPPRRWRRNIRKPQSRLFNPWSGYLSNHQLEQACNNIPLFARKSAMQSAFAAIKSGWLENGIRIGWTLKPTEVNSVTFVRRIDWKQKYSSNMDHSTLRHFLRRRMPIFEAIVFADGDGAHEVEGNALYRCYLVYILRLVCFVVLGTCISWNLVQAFGDSDLDSEQMGYINQATDEGDTDDADNLVQDVKEISSVFMFCSVILGTIMSRRFRCLLILLVPSLALTVGQSFLGAQLLQVAFAGPLTTLERNIRAAAATLSCLTQLSSNITRDTKEFIMESQLEAQVEKEKNYFQVIQEKAESIRNLFTSYKESAEKLMNEVNLIKK